jgi:hypothetical protein
MPDTDDHDHGDVEYGLVMPFVVCASKGGPFDDDAYVCGYEMGVLAEELRRTTEAVVGKTIHTQNVPQADLLGMEAGFQVESRPAEMFGETWSYVRFTKPVLIDGHGRAEGVGTDG